MSKGKAELKRRAQAMLATLVERFPRCFTREQPKPLKIGIDQDIIAEMPGTVETLAAQTDLRLAMRLYTGSPAYLQALVEGATRVDLAGAPAGIVKATHAGFAKYRLRRMGAEVMTKPPPVPPRNQSQKGNRRREIRKSSSGCKDEGPA